MSDTTPTVFADLRSDVKFYWDRGLGGLAISPDYATDGSVYVQYTWDHNPVSDMPGNPYGAPVKWNDLCPANPGSLGDGCPVGGRISRLEANGAGASWDGTEHILLQDWCQQ